jgi:hypothetical protein
VAKQLDEQIDRLYQLPLEQFTAARNALAKEAGSDGAGIKQLVKPALAAWAVNQLFWDRRDDYERLVDAAETMRKAHKAVIEGKRGDLRAAGREHELAVEKALKATIDLLKEHGQPVTEASRQAILSTIRALPADDTPGRLSKVLSPGGFEMLAGVKPAARAKTDLRTQAPPDRAAKGPKDPGRAERAAREAAERAVREAEHRMRRAEFETARAVRDAGKAQKRLEEAQQALEAAQEEAEAAKKDAAAADRAREVAERKSRDAESALEAAKRELRTST